MLSDFTITDVCACGRLTVEGRTSGQAEGRAIFFLAQTSKTQNLSHISKLKPKHPEPANHDDRRRHAHHRCRRGARRQGRPDQGASRRSFMIGTCAGMALESTPAILPDCRLSTLTFERGLGFDSSLRCESLPGSNDGCRRESFRSKTSRPISLLIAWGASAL